MNRFPNSRIDVRESKRIYYWMPGSKIFHMVKNTRLDTIRDVKQSQSLTDLISLWELSYRLEFVHTVMALTYAKDIHIFFYIKRYIKCFMDDKWNCWFVTLNISLEPKTLNRR